VTTDKKPRAADILSRATQIDYKDWGSVQPVVFSHGWPLIGAAETRRRSRGVQALRNACKISRVIGFDRPAALNERGVRP
jgi:pimeloyl-ACP methyl ester carboxylesterase